MKFFKKVYNYIWYHGFFASPFYLLKLLFLYCHRILAPGGYTVKKVNSRYKMYLNLMEGGISKALYLYGTRERDQVFIIQDIVKSGMRVLDIGANIGYYVLLEADIIGATGKVFAFEPCEDNFKALQMNVRLNNLSDRVRLYQMGISDRDGTMEFFVSPRSNLHTLNPKEFKERRQQPPFKKMIKIEVADITKFLRKERIDFIRMDIEGHEVEVLNGLFRGIEGINGCPSILLETHLSKYDDTHHSMRNAILNLVACGYDIEMIVSNNESKSPFREMGYNAERVIKTDQAYRGIYRNIKQDDALRSICDTGGIRAILLTAEPQRNRTGER